MNQVRVEELRPGMVLHEGLFSGYGARLLPRGVTLTSEMCRALRRSKQEVVFVPGAGAAPAAADASLGEGTATALATAEPPSPAPAARQEELSLVELIAGHEQPAPNSARAEAALRRSAEAQVAARAARWGTLPRRTPPAPESLRAVPTDKLAWIEVPDALPPAAAILQWRELRAAVVQRILTGLASGRTVDARVLLDLVDELIDRFGREPLWLAHVALLGRQEQPGPALAQQAYTAAALSIGMAGHLGWSRQHVRAAGLAGMLADAGMLLLRPEMHTSERTYGELEVNTLRRHPIYSAAMAGRVRGAPESIMLAVLQHHERLDGSGYPAGARGDEVHDLARLIAVADSFSAATTVRPHRLARSPFAVLRELTALSRPGPASPRQSPPMDAAAVGALVRLLGLFPPGSWVQLASGAAGVVTGCHDPARPDRPVVHLRAAGAGEFGVIDLSAPGHDDERVVAVLDSDLPATREP